MKNFIRELLSGIKSQITVEAAAQVKINCHVLEKTQQRDCVIEAVQQQQ